LTSKDGTTPQHQLSLLDIIPAGPESRSRGATQPFILGAFLYWSNESRNGGALHTVLCKWEFQVEKPTLHSAYGQLSSKKTNAFSSTDLPVRLHTSHFIDSDIVNKILVAGASFEAVTKHLNH